MLGIDTITRDCLHGWTEETAAGHVEIDFLTVEAIRRRADAGPLVISSHAHPRQVQILFISEGGGEVRIEGEHWTCQAPCFVVIPPAAVHHLSLLPDTLGWRVTAAASYAAEAADGDARLGEVLQRPAVLRLDGNADVDPFDLVARFQLLQREFVYAAPGRRLAILGHFAGVLVALYRAKLFAEVSAPAEDAAEQVLVVRYRELIELHFRTEKRVECYLDRLAVTAERLNAACRSQLGTNPVAMLHDRVITEAKRNLLYSGLSVAAIARTLGFDGVDYFSRFFLRRTGRSPERFRDELGGVSSIVSYFEQSA
jgi:AraC family transcriptional activator of pobA